MQENWLGGLRKKAKITMMKTYYLFINGVLGYGVRSPLINIGLFLKQVQINCMILDDGSNGVIGYFRPLLVFNYEFFAGFQDIFIVFCVLFSGILSSFFCLIFIQNYLKKKIIQRTLVFIVNIMTFIFNNILAVPYYLAVINSTTNFSAILSSIPTLFFAIFTCGILIFHILIFISVSYHSNYDSDYSKARSNSWVLVKMEIGVLFICFTYIYLKRGIFLALVFIIGLYFSREFLKFSPYFKFYQTYFECGFWVNITLNSLINCLVYFLKINFSGILVFSFLTIVSYPILWYYLDLSQSSLVPEKYLTPFEFDRYLRKELIGKNNIDKIKLGTIEDNFKKATKMFFESKILYIWEFNFNLLTKQDMNLASIKLSKMLFCETNVKNLKHLNSSNSYPFNFECDFLYYKLCKVIKNLSITSDSELIQYNENLILYKSLDFESCKSMISIIKLLFSQSKDSLKNSIKIFKKFSANNLRKNTLYKKLKERYGNDRKLIEMHEGFNCDILNENQKTVIAKYDTIKNIFADHDPFIYKLILSASPDSFGTICYSDENLANLLGFPYLSMIIGKKFKNLVFSSVWKPNKTLRNLLMFDYSTECIEKNIFLCNFNGFSTHLYAAVRVVFSKYSSQFIIRFEDIYDSSFVVFNSSGKVYTKSEKFQVYMSNRFFTYVEEVFPDILSIIQTNLESQEFEYELSNNTYYFTWEKISGIQEALILLNIKRVESHFNNNQMLRNQLNLVEKRKSIFFFDNLFGTKADITTVNRQKRKDKEDSKSDGAITSSFINESIRILYRIKVLIFGICLFTLLQVAVYSSNTVFLFSYFDDKALTDSLYSICSFRYNMAGVIINLRNLDLINKGVNVVAYNFSSYNQSLATNLNNSQNWLQKMESFGNYYDVNDIFRDPVVTVYDYYNKTLIPRKLHLFDALCEFVRNSFTLMRKNYTDEDLSYSLLKNGFYTLQLLLNESSYKSYLSIKRGSETMTFPILLINVISLFPVFLLFSFFSVNLWELKRIDRNIWKKINDKPLGLYSKINKKLVQRIQKIHDHEFIGKINLRETQKKSPNIFLKLLSKTLILCVLILLFFFFIHFFIQQNLLDIIKLRLDFRFYGGLRTPSIRAFMWAREYQLSFINKDYFSVFEENHESKSELEMTLKFLDDLYFLFDYTTTQTLRLNQNFNYENSVDFMIGNCCFFISNIANCSTNSICKGSFNAVKVFIQDILYLLSEKKTDALTILKLEKQSKIFEKMMSGIITLLDQTKANIDYYKNFGEISCIIMIFSIIFYVYFIIYEEVKDIKSDLLSRNDFLMCFENPEDNGKTSLGVSKRIN